MKSAYNSFDMGSYRRHKTVARAAAAEAPTDLYDVVRPLKPGPISVFVSRKEGKVFVRKGFEPVFEAPVTIDRPDQPLGTHVYTALAFNDDNTSLRWTVTRSDRAQDEACRRQPGKKGEPVQAAVGVDVERGRVRSIGSPSRKPRSTASPG